MNEAQFLISLGMKNVPLKREGLQTPAIISPPDDKYMVYDTELDGYVDRRNVK